MLMSGQTGISALAATLMALALAASGTAASAANYTVPKAAPAAVSNEALLKKLEAMEERIKFLEGKLEQKEEKENQKQEENGDQKQEEKTDQKQQPAGGKAAEAKPAIPARKARSKSLTPAAAPASTAPSPTPTAPPNTGILGVT